MAREKSNSEIALHPGFWCNCVVDDFISKGAGNALPTTWGGNITQRYGSAIYVAWVSITPSDILPAQHEPVSNTHPQPEVLRQAAFARLFALAPDYFVSRVQHVRKKKSEISQIASVARELHLEGDTLLYSDDGSLRTDKEIAAILGGRGHLQWL